MLYCPYTPLINNYYRADQLKSYISFFHASPNTPAVDVYANGTLIIGNLTYKDISPSLPVSPGNYNIKVYPAGQMINSIIDTNISVPENFSFNFSIIGTLPNVTLLPIPEPITAQNSGRACIRFIHLSPNAPAVDIRLSDGTMLFQNVSYKDYTIYACIPSGKYSFTVSPTGTNNVILTVVDVNLDPNNYYGLYAVGLLGETPPLEILLDLEQTV